MSLRDEIAVLLRDRLYGQDEMVPPLYDHADAVLALLRAGPWFDEAVERMLAEAKRLDPYGLGIPEGVMARLLRAALREGT